MSPRPLLPAALAFAALAAGCRDQQSAPPEPRLLALKELEVAVQQNLQRGALVSFWATW